MGIDHHPNKVTELTGEARVSQTPPLLTHASNCPIPLLARARRPPAPLWPFQSVRVPWVAGHWA
jgi:hypothetical protein